MAIDVSTYCIQHSNVAIEALTYNNQIFTVAIEVLPYHIQTVTVAIEQPTYSKHTFRVAIEMNPYRIQSVMKWCLFPTDTLPLVISSHSYDACTDG